MATDAADPHILLTNDDGIDAPGLRALHDALDAVGEVTVVAPARDQSGVGRGLSYGRMGPEAANQGSVDIDDGDGEPYTVTVPHERHELGYAVHGTPCDCVILGVRAFDPDAVVAGCNPGANLGIHVLPRSGTASAAEEAACLGLPGMALSVNGFGVDREYGDGDFDRACRVGRGVLVRALEAGVFDRADYLNVNVPGPDTELTGLSVTHPTPAYDMGGALTGEGFRLHNPLWAEMADREVPDDEGTDRRELLDGRVSVSPLSLRSTGAGEFDDLTGVFEGAVDGV